MLVKNWMSKGVITVDVDDSMSNATRTMKEHNIGMLPVMKKDKLVGVITDRDLKRASASDATSLEIHELLFLLSEIKVDEIMSKDPITVSPDFTVEETAEILMKNKISGVPVVDKGDKVVGVITQNDLFKVLISLTGISNRCVQFALIIEDRPGSIKEITDVIRKYDGRMVSILSSYDHVKKGYRKVYVRFYGPEYTKLNNMKEELNEKATLLYVIDHRENRREIYEME
ncbi:CBS and ACT domain-containing protein [Thermodesulfobacteriota bacterium]